MHVTITALILTAPDRKALRKGWKLADNASTLTSGVADLTDIHLLAEEASDAMKKLVDALDQPDATGGHKAVGDAAEKQVEAGPNGTD